MGRSALHVDRSSARAHASAAVSPVSRTIRLIHVVRGLPAGRFQSWCGVSQDRESTATFRALCAGVLSGKRLVAEDGVTTSGYGAEYAWQIRAVVYSPVGDEVIPSNANVPGWYTDIPPRTRRRTGD